MAAAFACITNCLSWSWLRLILHFCTSLYSSATKVCTATIALSFCLWALFSISASSYVPPCTIYLLITHPYAVNNWNLFAHCFSQTTGYTCTHNILVYTTISCQDYQHPCFKRLTTYQAKHYTAALVQRLSSLRRRINSAWLLGLGRQNLASSDHLIM